MAWFLLMSSCWLGSLVSNEYWSLIPAELYLDPAEWLLVPSDGSLVPSARSLVPSDGSLVSADKFLDPADWSRSLVPADW